MYLLSFNKSKTALKFSGKYFEVIYSVISLGRQFYIIMKRLDNSWLEFVLDKSAICKYIDLISLYFNHRVFVTRPHVASVNQAFYSVISSGYQNEREKFYPAQRRPAQWMKWFYTLY